MGGVVFGNLVQIVGFHFFSQVRQDPKSLDYFTDDLPQNLMVHIPLGNQWGFPKSWRHPSYHPVVICFTMT